MARCKDTQRTVKIFGIDGRAILLFTLAAMHFRWWTVTLCIVGVVALVIADRRGLKVPSALRAIRAWLAGDERPAILPWKKRRRVNYGG
jgi:intracellular multiplication protein IcmT